MKRIEWIVLGIGFLAASGFIGVRTKQRHIARTGSFSTGADDRLERTATALGTVLFIAAFVAFLVSALGRSSAEKVGQVKEMQGGLFLSSTPWRSLAFGMTAGLGFSLLIAQMASTPAAQTNGRQRAAAVLCWVGVAVAVSLSVYTFRHMGTRAGLAAIATAILVAPLPTICLFWNR